jgi:protein-disulfide isomerase
MKRKEFSMKMRVLSIVAILLLFSGCAEWREPPHPGNTPGGLEQSASGPTTAAAPSREAVRQEVEAVLRENPQMLLDVLSEHKIELFDIVNAGVKAKREQAENKQLEISLANPKQPAINPERPHIGSKDAPVVVVEYSDFLCPFCSRGAQTLQRFQQEHPDELVVYFKHMPLHENSMPPAIYFEALGKQNPELAWKFYDLAFQHAQDIAKGGEAYVKTLASQIPGVNMVRLEKDVQSEEILNAISQDTEEAGKFGIQGTPHFLVGGVDIAGAQPLSQFDKVLQLVTAKKAEK